MFWPRTSFDIQNFHDGDVLAPIVEVSRKGKILSSWKELIGMPYDMHLDLRLPTYLRQ